MKTVHRATGTIFEFRPYCSVQSRPVLVTENPSKVTCGACIRCATDLKVKADKIAALRGIMSMVKWEQRRPRRDDVFTVT